MDASDKPDTRPNNLPPSKPRYTPEEVAKAVEKGKGLVSMAARILGCTPQTVRNYVKRSALVRVALYEAREGMGDTAELSLYNAVLGGEPWAVQYYLKTQCKHRGYVERQELTGANGGALKVENYDLAITDLILADPEVNRLAHALVERLAGDASGEGEPAERGPLEGGEAPDPTE